jgi:hypothetical protein
VQAHVCILMCHLMAMPGLVWHLIIYADGITPGAVLSPENNRKAIVWYTSFLELGKKLAHEESWTTTAIARTCSCRHALQ